MALKILHKRALPIGVDFGSSRIKLAQLRFSGETVELLAAGSAEVPASKTATPSQRIEMLSQALRGVVRSSPFKGNRSILCIPARDTFVHQAKIPKLTPEATHAAVLAELRDKLPYPVEQAVVQEIVAGDVKRDGEQRREVIITAVSQKTLEAYLGVAERAKLDVIGVNIEACAVVECFSRLFRRSTDSARTIMYIDLGAFSTQVVLAHGNDVAFLRNLSTGGSQMDEAVAKGLRIGLSQARAMRRDLQKNEESGAAHDELYHLLDGSLDSMADELTQCLRYYESVFRNRSVERVIFVGGQAHDKRLCQALARRLNLPAQVGDPLLHVSRVAGAGLEIGLDRRQPNPDWAVAIGLSLGANKAA
jgi:type IV pilus assembly protein PilM